MRNIWAVLVTLALAATVWAQSATPPPALPDGIIGIVEIANIDTAKAHLQEYMTAVSPDTMVAAPITMALGELAKTTNPDLIETLSPMRVLFVTSASGGPTTTIQFTVKDAAAFRAALNPKLKDGEEKDGVTVYGHEPVVYAIEDDSDAAQAARRNMQTFVPPFAVGAQGKAFCLGKDAQAVRATLDLVRSGTLNLQPVLSATGDVNAYLKADALFAYLQAKPGGMFGSLRKGVMANMMGLQQGNEQVAKVQAILGAELDAVEAILGQLQSAQARLSFDAKDIRLSFSGTARPQTPLANYLASVPKEKPETLRYLPQDASVVAVLKVGDCDPLSAAFDTFIHDICGPWGVPPEKLDEIARMASEVMQIQGNEVSFALQMGAGMNVVEAIRVKDPAKYQALMKKMPELMSSISAANPSMAMTIAADAQPIPYKGHEITHWTITMPKAFVGGANAEMQAQATRVLFGDSPAMHSTMLGNDYVLAMGERSRAEVEQMIDGRAKTIMDLDAFKQAMADLPAENAGFVWFRLTSLLEMQGDLMRAAMPQAAAVFPEFSFEPGPGVAAVLTTSGPSATVELRVPAGELKALTDGAKRAATARVNLNNLSQIIKVVITYLGDHGDTLPPTLADLVPQYIDNTAVFLCPDDEAPMLIGNGIMCSYRYIGSVPFRKIGVDTFIAYDHTSRNGLRTVAHFDGHVSQYAEQEFTKKLAGQYEKLKPLMGRPGFPADRVKAFYEDKAFDEN